MSRAARRTVPVPALLALVALLLGAAPATLADDAHGGRSGGPLVVPERTARDIILPAPLSPDAPWSPPEDATLEDEIETLRVVSARLREQARALDIAGELEHLPREELLATRNGLLARLGLLASIRDVVATRAHGVAAPSDSSDLLGSQAWMRALEGQLRVRERIADLDAALMDPDLGRGQLQDVADNVLPATRRLVKAHERLAKDLLERAAPTGPTDP